MTTAKASETSTVRSAPGGGDPIVIVGAGLAGYNLLRELRKRDPLVPIVLIAADSADFYSKPLLSTGYTKGSSAESLVSSSASAMATQQNAQILAHRRVLSIDRSVRQIVLDDGQCLRYESLVLAVGGACIEPPLAGDAANTVLQINDLEDYRRFREQADCDPGRDLGRRRVLLIGAGLIGCEYANDLANGGFEVSVIDPQARPLANLLPEKASKQVQRGLESLGVRFYCGSVVERLDAVAGGTSAPVTRALLNTGETLEADIVLGAVGIRPRLELAREAGLSTGRGIVTDRYLRTSDAHIYALGDCAEVEGHVLYYVMPLMLGARALAKTLTGEPTALRYDAMPVTIKTPVCPTVVAPPVAGSAGQWEEEASDGGVLARFIGEQGELLGFALTGDQVRQKMPLCRQLPPWMA